MLDFDGIGTPRQFRWVRAIVYGILVLNLLDAVFTVAWVYLGVAREANPVLGSLVAGSPLLFVLSKVALVGSGSWLLWQHRERPLAIIGIFVAFIVYYWLLIYHLGYLSILVGSSTAA